MMQLEQTAAFDASTLVHIIAYRHQHRCATYKLAPGESVIIGSAKSCGLRLDGQGVSPMHCLISFHNGKLMAQEWPSSGGTYLNDQKMSGEAEIGEGCKLRIGDCLLAIEALPALNPVVCSPEAKHEPVDADVCEPSLCERDEPIAAEPVSDAGDFTSPPDADFSSVPVTPATRSVLEPDAAAHETIELLRAEVQELQIELAERDALLSEFMNAGTPEESSCAGELADTTDSAALVGRLDELLEELNKSDERTALLEDMLRASEEATYAEQEERRQLEAWVADIEKRIIARESEWEADCEKLRSRLSQLQAERDQVERQLQQSASGDDAKAHYESILQRLRQQNADLTERLERATTEQSELRRRLESADVQHAAETLQAKIDEALREERATMAQERAAMARVRADLTNKLSEMEQQLHRNEGGEGGVDLRIREFRRHLREIHEQEQGGRERGLMSRIASLWKRVDD